MMDGQVDGMRPRVLLVVNSLEGGGAERVCLNLAHGLSRDYDVDIVVLYPTCDHGFQDADGINVSSIDMGSRGNFLMKLCSVPKGIAKLNKIVREKEKLADPYALIAAHLTAAHVVSRLSCIGKRCLYVHHSLARAVMGKHLSVAKELLRFLYRDGYHTCVSQGVKDEICRYWGVKKNRASVVVNPIPCEEIRKLATEPVPARRPYLLFVGRLVESKRPGRALEAFVQGGFSKDYDLVFAGQGPLEGALKARAEQLGVSGTVKFLGFCKNPYSWMHFSSVLLLTSDHEALPTVVIEGLVAGARVVSDDCYCGPREIMTGELADYLVPPDDIDGLVAKVRLALERYPRIPEGFEERFSTNSVCRSYLDCYNEAFRSFQEVKNH